MPPAAPETPARGTRPRNRRAITLQVATELFYRRGFAQVGMSDIAEATNVGASALYRHFPSKSELLVAAIQAGLAPYAEVLFDPAHAEQQPAARLEGVLRRLSGVAIEHRRLGVLWQRDARNLDEADQRGLREELSRSTGELAHLVAAARPELDSRQADALAWCAMGALVSLGFHALQLPRPTFDDLLVDIVTGVTTAPLQGASALGAPTPATTPRAVPVRGGDDSAGGAADHPESRREGLISVATALFADRGFAAAGIDEIGDAVGMAGPSVYSHFESKRAILAAAIQRASGMLRSDLDAVLANSDPATVKLAALVDSYVGLVNQDRFIVRTLISEMDQLPGPDRDLARSDQRAYVDAWVGLYRAFTEVDPVSARIRVQAVLLVVNDAVQTPHLRSQPGFEQTVGLVAKNVLGIAPRGGGT